MLKTTTMYTFLYGFILKYIPNSSHVIICIFTERKKNINTPRALNIEHC